MSDGEVLTLAIFSRWPRWRSDRDFWRFASARLAESSPNLLSQQPNPLMGAVEPEIRALQRDLACEPGLAQGLPHEHVVLERADGDHGPVEGATPAGVPEQGLGDPGARAELVAEVRRGEAHGAAEPCKAGRPPETNASSSASAVSACRRRRSGLERRRPFSFFAAGGTRPQLELMGCRVPSLTVM